MSALELPLAAAELLPHRPPMLLVDTLVEQDGPNGVVETLVRPDNPLLEADGRLTEVALIELMAQAYGVVKGRNDLLLGQPVKEGFLVAVKQVRLQGPVRVGDRLRIAVQLAAELDGFGIVDGTVSVDGREVAVGNFRVYVPEAA